MRSSSPRTRIAGSRTRPSSSSAPSRLDLPGFVSSEDVVTNGVVTPRTRPGLPTALRTAASEQGSQGRCDLQVQGLRLHLSWPLAQAVAEHRLIVAASRRKQSIRGRTARPPRGSETFPTRTSRLPMGQGSGPRLAAGTEPVGDDTARRAPTGDDTARRAFVLGRCLRKSLSVWQAGSCGPLGWPRGAAVPPGQGGVAALPGSLWGY